jgi:excisionase family DNA binding protein
MSVTRKREKAKRLAAPDAAKPHLQLVPSTPVPLPAGAPQFLTVLQVASMFHLTPKTIYNMVSQRRIPFRKAGHQLLFDVREIEAWTKTCADNQ